ncbi:filament integrity protein FraC [Leptolyngbya sp. AN02str]|uniref:filament integrity protein FraC n=1 Tax=Leptolyngbya sp. AN02str TaxID=3423363 RepID=UPI003D322D6D
MFFSVLPLRAVAFQAMFLLLAIAIEAHVLQRELKLVPKKAAQYAMTLNLLTVAVGWFLFFGFEPFLRPPVKAQLLNFIFFDRWSTDTVFWFILAGFIIFFTSFIIKLLGLQQLELLLTTPQDLATQQEKTLRKNRLGSRKKQQSGLPRQPRQASALLSANAFSYTAILLLLFTRMLFVNVPVL